MEDTELKLRQLQEINSNFTSDLKIQKRIRSKLKKELEVSEERRKIAETEQESGKQRLELVNLPLRLLRS